MSSEDATRESDPDLEASAQGGVSATYRVTAIMHALTEPGEGLSVRAVAEATATSRSATHRILQSLVDEGYAVQGSGGRYLSGPRMLRLAARTFTGTSAIRLADAIMTSLVDEVDETAYLATFLPEERAVSFVHRVEPSHPLRYIQKLGVPLPLDRGAIGKAILADAGAVAGPAIEADPALAATLEEIRSVGYAVTHEERVEGVTGIAAAVRARGIVIGGLTLAVPTVRIQTDRIDDLGRRVSHYAAELSDGIAALGSSTF